jgi:sugar fermentation stimulation protein A
MTGCATPATPSGIPHQKPKRKYAHTWELTKPNGAIICVNTAREYAGKRGDSGGNIPELSGYNTLKSEVKYGDERAVLILCYRQMTDKTAILK